MQPTGFGKKGTVNEDMAAKRTAFLAAERQRSFGAHAQTAASQTSDRESMGSGFAPAGFTHDEARSALGLAPSRRPEKSLAVAYLCWFLLGQVSAHRFYLGAYQSAVVQALMVFGSAMMVIFSLNPKAPGIGVIFVFPMLLGVLWMLADVFLIPRIRDRMERKNRPEAFSAVFN